MIVPCKELIFVNKTFDQLKNFAYIYFIFDDVYVVKKDSCPCEPSVSE